MQRAGSKTAYAAIAANLIIAVTKFAAAWYSGSSAMWSEGIHSVVDTSNEILLLYGLYRASRPADEIHPFGHGRELYFWSFVVAILVFGLGAGLSGYEGLTRLADPRPVESPLISLAVLVVCGAAESWSWNVARGELRKALPDCDLFAAISRSRNPAIFIVLLEDTAAIAGIAAAFIGVALSAFAGMPVFDGLASLAVACILAVTAVYMAVEVKGLLIGEPAPRRIADGIGALATREEAIERVNDLFTIQLGPDQVVALLRAQFRPALPAADLTEAVGRLRSAVRKAFPQVVAVFVTPESAAKEKQT